MRRATEMVRTQLSVLIPALRVSNCPTPTVRSVGERA